MRPSRFLVVFVSFVMLLVVASLCSAQTITLVHAFNIADGQYPGFEILAQGRDGNLYGTTYQGGSFGQGAVFRKGSAGMTAVTLHSFGDPMGQTP